MSLELRFELERKELVISFNTEWQARAYQRKNPESRIFFDGSRRDVWLPMVPSMKYIRASSVGFAICFSSPELAKRWCGRSIIGIQLATGPGTEVLIYRQWGEDKLEKLLGSYESESGRLLDPERDRFKDGIHTSKRGGRSASPGPAKGAASYSDGRT
jgi:hypothetical protein